MTHTPGMLRISQAFSFQRLLSRFEREYVEPFRLSLSDNVAFIPRHGSEIPLTPDAHHAFRALVKGILYLAHCTRPGLSTPFRHWLAAFTRLIREIFLL